MRAFALVVTALVLAGTSTGVNAQVDPPPRAPAQRPASADSIISAPELERGPLDRAAIDTAIDGIIAREHYEYVILPYFRPILDTQIEDEKRHGEEEVPWRHWSMRGRGYITQDPGDLSVQPLVKQDRDNPYDQTGFLSEAFIDRTGFDRQHYSFRYAGHESIEGVECLVFDIAPLAPSPGGRFRGRIWANTRDYTIIRFKGTYLPMHRWELVPTPHRLTILSPSFDSWRTSVEPEMWLPSNISSQQSGLRYITYKWDFSAETQFTGYDSTEIVKPRLPSYSQQTFQGPVPIRRRLGKQFWTAWGVNLGLMVARDAIIVHCMDNHECKQADPIFGNNAGQIYGETGALFAMTFLLARHQKLHDSDPMWWHYETYFPMMVFGGETVYTGTHLAAEK